MPIDEEKLLRMAEQIAANMRYSDDLELVAGKTADHINRFWEPGMRATLLAYAARDNSDMSDSLRLAINQVQPPK